jgi:hypothetical protein
MDYILDMYSLDSFHLLEDKFKQGEAESKPCRQY